MAVDVATAHRGCHTQRRLGHELRTSQRLERRHKQRRGDAF